MNKKHLLVGATALAVTAFAFAGCAPQQTNTSSDNPINSNTSGTNNNSAYSSGSNNSVSQQGSQGGAQGATQAQAQAAIDLALSTVGGGVVIDLDLDDSGTYWDVTVIKDGTDYSLDISVDGTQVLEQDDAEPADTDENAKAIGAKTTAAEALITAMTKHPGLVQDIDLESNNGQLEWQVKILPEGQQQLTRVLLSADTGEVL